MLSASCCLDITNGAVKVTARWEDVAVDGFNVRDPSTGTEGGDIINNAQIVGSMTTWLQGQVNINDILIVTFFDGFTQVGQVSIQYTGVACAD